MVNLDNYMEECSARAESAYEAFNGGRKYMSRRESFHLRYFCYVLWGMPFGDKFNKDFRAANFFAKVLEYSYEYANDFASYGYDKYEVAAQFKRIKRAARMLGYRGEFKVYTFGRRVKVLLGEIGYSVSNPTQAVETMFYVADYIVSKCVDEEIAEFAGSFMEREYNYMKALSIG